MRASVSLNYLNIPQTKFKYFSISLLKYIDSVHDFLGGDISHFIKFWNHGITINNEDISRRIASFVNFFEDVSGMIYINNHLKNVFDYIGVFDTYF